MEQELKEKIFELAKEYYKAVNSKKTKDYIPVSGKILKEDDLINMIDASLDMWLTAGRFNDKFEKEFSKYLDVKYAHTTTSGSSANLLAITSLTSPLLRERALKPDDEVITVAAGFPTTVNAIIQNGLVPVFIDTRLATYDASSEDIEKAITPKTKAVIFAHTLGNMFEIDKIQEICKKHNLWLVEDSCDALGAEFNGKKAGTIGDIGTFSFYPAHHITMGEGGAVVTNNSLIAKAVKSLRDWGRDCVCPPGHDGVCGKRFEGQFGKMPFGYDHKYIYSHTGYNLKITDWQAAIGLSQLKKLPEFLKIREQNANYLLKKLDDLREYFILPEVTKNSKSSWFGFLIGVRENNNFKKQELVEYLENNGVGTRQLFAGNILRQPSFVNSNIKLKINNSEIKYSCDLKEEDYALLPNTEFIMNNVFWVGVYPALGEVEMDKISDLIHKFVKKGDNI